MKDNQQAVPNPAAPPATLPPVLAPALMIAFWALLGAASGIRLMEGIWRFVDFQVGEFSIVVPVGAVVGAFAGGLLGLITNPRLQVLLMAVFAGAAAGAVAGKLPWGDVGEIGGQVVGSLVGGMAWAAWLFIGRRREPKTMEVEPSRPDNEPIDSALLDHDARSFHSNKVQAKP